MFGQESEIAALIGSATPQEKRLRLLNYRLSLQAASR
jgi:hypothetical protein